MFVMTFLAREQGAHMQEAQERAWESVMSSVQAWGWHEEASRYTCGWSPWLVCRSTHSSNIPALKAW